jgi:hypothetical protein
MRFYNLLLLLILLDGYAYSQKLSIEKLSKDKIDSLRNEHVDTIMWYHSYCGECLIVNRPDTPIIYSNCTLQLGYKLNNNLIFYKQKGKYFVINFDCNNITIKRQINVCKALPYFISIIPALDSRDKAIKDMYKKGGSYSPWQMDGGLENMDIYFNKKSQHISMSSKEETDKLYKKYAWIDKQIMLLNLISADIRIKKKS